MRPAPAVKVPQRCGDNTLSFSREVCVRYAGLVLSLFVACATEDPEQVAAARLQGSWAVEPSAADRRKAELLQLAFGEPPPSEAQLSQADLTADEQQMVRSILAARAQDPSSPQLAQTRSHLAGMGSATLEITADELRFTLGKTTSTRTYSVVSAGDDAVQVEVVHPGGKTEQDTFVFRDPDTVELREPSGNATVLRRRAGGG